MWSENYSIVNIFNSVYILYDPEWSSFKMEAIHFSVDLAKTQC